MDRNADRCRTIRRNHSVGHQLQTAIMVDSQNRQLVAARIHRNQKAAIVGHLDRALRCQPTGRACACAAGHEGRRRKRREGTVEVAVESADRVGADRVVIEIDVADDR